MNEQNRIVAEAVAGLASELIPVLVNDQSLPKINTEAEAREVISYAVTQDKWTASWRVAAALCGALATVLALPPIQSIIGPWGTMGAAILAALSAGISKALDPRPTSMQ